MRCQYRWMMLPYIQQLADLILLVLVGVESTHVTCRSLCLSLSLSQGRNSSRERATERRAGGRLGTCVCVCVTRLMRR
jgi:hypothetical protein